MIRSAPSPFSVCTNWFVEAPISSESWRSMLFISLRCCRNNTKNTAPATKPTAARRIMITINMSINQPSFRMFFKNAEAYAEEDLRHMPASYIRSQFTFFERTVSKQESQNRNCNTCDQDVPIIRSHKIDPASDVIHHRADLIPDHFAQEGEIL